VAGQADELKAGKIFPEEIERPAIGSNDHFMFLPEQMPDDWNAPGGMTYAPVKRAD